MVNTLILLSIPLVAAALITLLWRRGQLASVISALAALAIMALALFQIYDWDGQPIEGSMSWLHLGGLDIRMGLYFDNLAATLLFVVATVGFWIHLFSLDYMHKDVHKTRFFGGLSLFMFSMLGIVFADNLIMLYLFWELVSFSSYLLIAHYWKTPAAREASKKAFIVNRIGDFGFLIGIIWCYWHFGTVNFQELKEVANPATLELGIGLLLMCGFLGKSAQFPLHVWLPDAMAGPTPVSALIHAATMVAAGIYFLCRIYFLLPAETLTVVLVLGIAMMVYASFCALSQRDIKRILAYSTLAQLGCMAAAIGLGYPGLALFHLSTHAFFKALLFLGAGSVIHACAHEQDIFKMGGLLKRMPVTGWTFIAGTIALCGVNFTSGYFSKDSILVAAFLSDKTAFSLLLFASFLTALYMGRLFWIAFLGKPKTAQAEQARETSVSMCAPLVVLAALSLVGGLLTLWPPTLKTTFLTDLDILHANPDYEHAHTAVLIGGSLCWILGLSIAGLFYRAGATEDRLEKRANRLYKFLQSRLYFDEVYNAYVTKVQDPFTRVLSFLDLVFISGLLVRGTAGVTLLIGNLSRRLHTGSIQNYAYWFLGGLVLFWAIAVGWLF